MIKSRNLLALKLLGTLEGGNVLGILVAWNMSADRLLLLGHWTKYIEKKGNCVVCQGIMKKKKLSSKSFRHKSRIQCEHCSVYCV